MAVKTKKGLKLDSLLGKMIKVKDRYEDNPQGPFRFLGLDYPMIALELDDKIFWWSLLVIEAIREDISEEQ